MTIKKLCLLSLAAFIEMFAMPSSATLITVVPTKDGVVMCSDSLVTIIQDGRRVSDAEGVKKLFQISPVLAFAIAHQPFIPTNQVILAGEDANAATGAVDLRPVLREICLNRTVSDIGKPAFIWQVTNTISTNFNEQLPNLPPESRGGAVVVICQYNPTEHISTTLSIKLGYTNGVVESSTFVTTSRPPDLLVSTRVPFPTQITHMGLTDRALVRMLKEGSVPDPGSIRSAEDLPKLENLTFRSDLTRPIKDIPLAEGRRIAQDFIQDSIDWYAKHPNPDLGRYIAGVIQTVELIGQTNAAQTNAPQSDPELMILLLVFLAVVVGVTILIGLRGRRKPRFKTRSKRLLTTENPCHFAHLLSQSAANLRHTHNPLLSGLFRLLPA